MYTKFDDDEKRSRGRPVEGVEKKYRIRSVRLEKSIDDEFMYCCQITGLSPTKALRHGIMMFIRHVHKHYG